MKIAWLSDFNLMGSGYLNLSVPLCNGLTARGMEINCIGLGYRGDEHPHEFSIIPAQDFREVLAILQNLTSMWGVDVFVVALDIPLQERLLVKMQDIPFKYVGIMPVEADPLCVSWAMALTQMDKAFIISQFGADEATKAGVDAEHLLVGIDTESWRLPTKEERESSREMMGFDEDTFAILTVADNQERKHLSRSMEMFTDFAKDKENVKYVLVTREHNPVGWRLRDLAGEFGINNQLMIFERGMSFKELWAIYVACDAFLLTSKAEGLGLPLLEAMAVGLPCIGTNCTAIAEVLGEDRGLLIDVAYTHRDPFGNGRRYFASREDGRDLLDYIHNPSDKYVKGHITRMKNKGKKHIEERVWDIGIEQLHRALMEFE